MSIQKFQAKFQPTEIKLSRLRLHIIPQIAAVVSTENPASCMGQKTEFLLCRRIGDLQTGWFLQTSADVDPAVETDAEPLAVIRSTVQFPHNRKISWEKPELSGIRRFNPE